jgi:hypothetical protein
LHYRRAARAAWLAFLALQKTEGVPIMVVGFDWIFIPLQNKPQFPETESVCGFQDAFVKFLCDSAPCMPQIVRDILR